MKISKIKAIWNLITGGIAGLTKYLLELFNTQVLSKIKDKETGEMYLNDVVAIIALIKAILSNHGKCLSDGKRAAGESVLIALNTLATALSDFHIDGDEFENLTADISRAIDAWKAAK